MKRLIFIYIAFALLLSCKADTEVTPKAEMTVLEGSTMGTYYVVKYKGEAVDRLSKSIADLLENINGEVSTYIDTSAISRFNKGSEPMQISMYPHFVNNFTKSLKIYESTKGFFDPTVMPLVNYWGFGTTGKKAVTRVDSVKIGDILEYVGLYKIQISKDDRSYTISKEDPRQSLDFSAIAKGYAVDEIANLLISNSYKDFYVEIGGELRTGGTNANNEPWTIGINKPDPKAKLTDITSIIKLSGMAAATSGNYRNFYEVDGRMYGHEIHPSTGFPSINSLLSATVVADQCAVADAYATAFMVMGLEASMGMVEYLDNLEAMFIIGNEDGEYETLYSKGFESYIVE